MQPRNIIRAVISFALYLFFVPAILFISSGTVNWPMAWVYVVLLLASLALPVMLDVIWALVPTLVMVVALVIRTGLEDRMLREELAGYASYAEETPYRLIPGLW